MPDLTDLEFLSEKSHQLIEKQISAYRQKHSNAGSVIAIIALFIPFFLNGLTDAFLCVKIFSVIPVILFVIAVMLLLEVLQTKSLDQGFHPDKFDYLVNLRNYEQVLLYEIGANRSSFIDNEKITQKANKSFNLGIRSTLIAVILSILILLFNSFFKPNKESQPQKVEIINLKNMSENNSNSQDTSASNSANVSGNATPSEPIRTIPTVPATDRVNLNETIVNFQTKVDTGKKGE